MIFVDTSFWVALRLNDDDHHDEAVELLRSSGGDRLLTSNQVRGETWTFLRRKDGHRTAVEFLAMLEATSKVAVVRIEERLEVEALRWLRRHDEREYSFVDATSFALMRSLRIKEALAFDGDFSAAGFVELRPQYEQWRETRGEEALEPHRITYSAVHNLSRHVTQRLKSAAILPMTIVVLSATNAKPAAEGPLDLLVLTFQTFWWLWATIALIGLSKAVWRLYQWRRLAQSGIRDIDAMDGRTFELFLVTLFQRLGYKAEHTGRTGGDYGADLVITTRRRRTAVQAKRSSGNVGVKAVQEALAAKGMYSCTGALVVTNGGYTRQARHLARANDVELWDRDALVERLLRSRRRKQGHASSSTVAVTDRNCVVCNVAVSEKVWAYCVTHAERFGGRIYCFKHQRA